jgi:hypothetical protein
MSRDDDFLNQIIDYRRARNRETRDTVLSTLGAMAESIRTGESAPSVGRRWMTDYSDSSLTAAQRVEARQDALDTLQDVEKARLDQATKRANDVLEALKARLSAAVRVRGQDIGASETRSRNAMRALSRRAEELQQDLNEYTTLDERSQNILKSYFDAQDQVTLDAARRFQGRSEEEIVSAILQANPNASRAAARAEARKIKEASPKELQQFIDPDQIEGAKGALDASLIDNINDPSVPDAQRLNILRAVATQRGADPRALAERFGFEVGELTGAEAFDALNTRVAVGQENITRQRHRDLKDLVRQARAVGASSSSVDTALGDLDRHISAMRSGQAAPTMTSQRIVREGTGGIDQNVDDARRMAARARAGAQPPAPPAQPPLPGQERLDAIRQSTDPAEQAVATLQYIEDYPEGTPAQQMWEKIRSSPRYDAWKRKRGYEGFDEKLIRKELLKEAKRAQKRRKRQFHERAELNRARGEASLVPSRPPSSELVAGSMGPTSSTEEGTGGGS